MFSTAPMIHIQTHTHTCTNLHTHPHKPKREEIGEDRGTRGTAENGNLGMKSDRRPRSYEMGSHEEVMSDEDGRTGSEGGKRKGGIKYVTQMEKREEGVWAVMTDSMRGRADARQYRHRKTKRNLLRGSAAAECRGFCRRYKVWRFSAAVWILQSVSV